jgi:hypothetical protein
MGGKSYLTALLTIAGEAPSCLKMPEGNGDIDAAYGNLLEGLAGG